jgi:hypothetical protein
MCRKSILFVLVFLVFTYVLSKEVKSQAPVKPLGFPAVSALENDTVPVPAKAVSLSPPLLTNQDFDADRAPGKVAGTTPSMDLPLEPVKVFQAPAPPPPSAVVVTTVTSRKSVNIWSIQIEQADGKNIVRATIGKKSAVRIVCDQLSLQTPSDIFQAQGNVELSGEGVQGRCEKLTINLSEDHLILDGKADVGIYKEQGLAKNGPVTSQKFLVELKGEHLSLRWPELQINAEEMAPPPPSAYPSVPPQPPDSIKK